MEFTRDIRRLLGLGGDGPEEEDVMEGQGGGPGANDGNIIPKSSPLQESMLSHEEGLDDEEKTRRRNRRRAKRKRQKERKKLLEREERMGEGDTSEQDTEVTSGVSESDSEQELKVEEWITVRPRNKGLPYSHLMTTENKGNHQLPYRTSKEEPELDINSAFVANAASHIKVKGLKTQGPQISRENKENESSSSQVESTEEMKRRGESLTVQGIQMFERGQYNWAVDMFTEAIHCHPKDHRFYGNRSYCYWCLEQYQWALTDAQRSIQLAPEWAKGYFRKGCALMGLKRYSEAEKAMEEVLKLDPSCNEASSKSFTCQLMQLTELGFSEEHGRLLLEKFRTVQAVVASPEAQMMKHSAKEDRRGNCRSLWVGNITLEVTEKHLWDLFKMFGDIESIGVLHERFCAFVNFQNANMAANALEKLQGVELGSSRLVMRYPDRWIQRSLPSVHRTSSGLSSGTSGTQQSSAVTGTRRRPTVNGDECVYWRTTGCFYGDRCRFKHMPDQQGRDKKQ